MRPAFPSCPSAKVAACYLSSFFSCRRGAAHFLELRSGGNKEQGDASFTTTSCCRPCRSRLLRGRANLEHASREQKMAERNGRNEQHQHENLRVQCSYFPRDAAQVRNRKHARYLRPPDLTGEFRLCWFHVPAAGEAKIWTPCQCPSPLRPSSPVDSPVMSPQPTSGQVIAMGAEECEDDDPLDSPPARGPIARYMPRFRRPSVDSPKMDLEGIDFYFQSPPLTPLRSAVGRFARERHLSETGSGAPSPGRVASCESSGNLRGKVRMDSMRLARAV